MRIHEGLRAVRALATPVIAGVLATACGSSSTLESDRPVVIVSVPPQATFVERIAGGRVSVEVMIPPGANPHLYEPGMRRMRSLSRAPLYIAVGHPRLTFERAWLPELGRTNPEMRVIRSGASCRSLADDPHMWLAPSCAQRMVMSITEALQALLPESREEFRERREELREEIARVDREITDRLAPYSGRSFLVFHPAWGYFAREYGLRQRSIGGGAREPNPAELASLLREVRGEEVSAVFAQPQMSREAVDLVARELGVEVRTIDPLDANWSANLLRVAETLESAFAARASATP